VLAFGYTNCADICPFTLGYLKRLYEELSNAEQKKIQILFVTIDPQYDTPNHLKEFITYFNKNFIGITGTKNQIDNIVSLFQAEYHTLSDATIETKDMRRVNPKTDVDIEKDKALLYTHSVTIYLIDKELRVRSLEYTGTPREEFANKIRQLIDE
jgi:protein SCO1/2